LTLEVALPERQPQRIAFNSNPMAVAAAVVVAHGMIDLYSAFLHPLLPRIMNKLGLNIALAATLAMTLSLASSLVQPVMGELADRFGRRLFVVVGPLLTAVFMSMIGRAPSFGILVLFLALGGLGSAAFHPPAASLAASGGGKGMGTRYSWFSFGGALGYALGPVTAVTIVSRAGLDRLWLAMLPMLFIMPMLYFVFPSGQHERAHRHVHGQRPPILQLLRGPLGLVFGVSAVAALIQRVFLTMQPIVVNRAGGSEATGAFLLSLYLGAQAVGSFFGGFMADRMDRRKLLLYLTLLSLPSHVLAMGLPAGTVLALTATAVAGFLNMALLPPIVIMAQELVPAGRSLGSGIVMGLAWATGSVFMLGVGVLADVIGPRPASLLAMPTMLIGTAFAWALPRRIADRGSR
jgi:MFS transporter, FSR family, fosmidomycin resistance protein